MADKLIDKRMCKDKNNAKDVFCLESLKNKYVPCKESKCNSYDEKYFKKSLKRLYRCGRMNYRSLPCSGYIKPSWCPHLNTKVKDKQ